MLCAFASLDSLQKCVQSIHSNGDNLRDFMFFQAKNIKSEDEKSENDLFGIALQKDKVGVIEEWRTLDDLQALFPFIESSVLESVWKTQHSWTASLNILHSLVLSHNGQIMINNCDIVFEDEAWPNILESLGQSSSLSNEDSKDSQHQLPHQMASLSISSQQSDADWTFVKVETPEDVDIYHNRYQLQTVYDPNYDWEVLKFIPSPIMNKSHLSSYKAALLQKETSSNNVVPSSQSNIAWGQPLKPLFVGSGGRSYRGIENRSKPPEEAKKRTLYPDEEDYNSEDEADMMWDVCCNTKFASQSTMSVKRKSNITMIRPNAHDQKVKRIAMKTK